VLNNYNPSHMPRSKTAIFVQSGIPMKLQYIQIPELKPKESLVRNEYVTLCRSDLNTFCGKRIEPTPTILGHEVVGRIAAFGNPAVKTDLRGSALGIGDRVSWAIFASDPDSELSKAGIPQKGINLFKYGHERLTEDSVLHGGLGEYTLLRANTPVVKISESIPLKVAATINCAVATVSGALRLSGGVAGKNILIAGAGMLGLISCAMVTTRGAKAIAALDVNAQRLKLAQHFGANMTLLADEALDESIFSLFGKKAPFHVVIDMSGVASTMEYTLNLLSIGGTAVWAGATHPERSVQIEAEKIVRNLLTIKGLHNYNIEDFLTAVEFMERHHRDFPFADLIHDHFSLNTVNEAFEYGLQQNPFRTGIKID
jgi:putative phosphonate catabolism associated alcohol dehydrogenase